MEKISNLTSFEAFADKYAQNNKESGKDTKDYTLSSTMTSDKVIKMLNDSIYEWSDCEVSDNIITNETTPERLIELFNQSDFINKEIEVKIKAVEAVAEDGGSVLNVLENATLVVKRGKETLSPELTEGGISSFAVKSGDTLKIIASCDGYEEKTITEKVYTANDISVILTKSVTE